MKKWKYKKAMKNIAGVDDAHKQKANKKIFQIVKFIGSNLRTKPAKAKWANSCYFLAW